MADGLIDTRDDAVTTPEPVALRGNLESVGTDGRVSGWCWSPDEPSARRLISVEVDGVEVTSLVADQIRADLQDAGVGDGAHAFQGTIPDAARVPGRACVVAVRDAASGQQIGGDASVDWPGDRAQPAEIEPPALHGALDRVTRDGWVSGWCWYPAEPDRRVELTVLVDGEIVGRTRAASFRPDLPQAGIGDGAHAFSYALPWSVMGSKGTMTITVQDAATARRLGDPITLRLGKMAATEERIEDLERQVLLLRGHIEELTEQARRPAEDPARALFQTVGAFFQELAEDVAGGRAIGPGTGLRGAVADVTGRYAPIVLAVPEAPAATLVIDASVPFDALYRCLAALQGIGVDRLAEIVVVDDGAHSGEAALLPLVVRNLRLVHMRPGAGLLAGRNEAARMARGPVVVFLAPEVEPAEGWLPGLLSTFEREPQAAAIGSRVVRADGTLLHAGLLADQNGVLRVAGKGEAAAHPAFAFLRPVHAVPDIALAVRREAFAALDGFSPAYRGGAAAAIDLCLRLRQAGHAVLVQGADLVRWTAEAPPSARVAPDFLVGDEDAQMLQRRVLRPGWREEAETGPPRVRPLGRALVVDTEMPRPDRDAGSVATLEQMRLLCRLGYHVTFAAADGDMIGPAEIHRLESQGIEVARAPGCASVTECLEERGAWLDLVQVYRHANASMFLERIRALAPRARLVFSPADLHFLREAREAAVTGRDPGQEAADTRAAELRCVEAADATILPSDHEVAVLAEHVAPEKLVLLRWIARPEPSPVPFAARSGACFVGNFNHGPNADGVHWFVRDILPRVLAEIPGFRLHVAGSNMGADIQALASAAVVVHGWVPDLGPFFASMRASVAPLRYGAGFKGKVATSLAHGLPSVCTAVALEGSGLAAGDGVLTGDDPADFAAALVRLHEDAALWEELSAAGLARCAILFSPEAALDIYRDLFTRLRLPTASPARG